MAVSRDKLTEARGRSRALPSAESTGLLVVEFPMLAQAAPSTEVDIVAESPTVDPVASSPTVDIANQEDTVAVSPTVNKELTNTPTLAIVTNTTPDTANPVDQAATDTPATKTTKRQKTTHNWATYATPPSTTGTSPYESRINIPITPQANQTINHINHTLATQGHRYPLNRSQYITQLANQLLTNPDHYWNEYQKHRNTLLEQTPTTLQARIPTETHNALRAASHHPNGKRPITTILGWLVSQGLTE